MSTFSFTITLPELSTQQAIALWEALHHVADAIWDVHGDAMGQVFAEDAIHQLEHELDVGYDPDDDLDDDVAF